MAKTAEIVNNNNKDKIQLIPGCVEHIRYILTIIDDLFEQRQSYYRREGLLKATRVGKRIRYLKSELIQLLDRLTSRTNDDVS